MEYSIEEQEVTLAGAWERIGAALINAVLLFLACIPLVVGFIMGVMNYVATLGVDVSDASAIEQALWDSLSSPEAMSAIFSSGGVLLGAGILLAFTVWQCVLMGKYGQSLGKKWLNLKVIKENGTEAGFVGVVLLREVVYTIIASIVMTIVLFLLVLILGWDMETVANNGMADLLNNVPTLICLLMLFISTDRRTLQDKLAGTVVVKLPSPNKSTQSTSHKRVIRES